MTDLTLKLVLEALDRGATTQVRRYTAVVGGLSREVRTGTRSWFEQSRAIGQVNQASERYVGLSRRAEGAIDRLIERQRRLRVERQRERRGWLDMGGDVEADGRRRLGGGRLAAAGLAGVAGGALGTAAGQFLGRGPVQLAQRVFDEGAYRRSALERISLIHREGDAAREAMGWIDRFSRSNAQQLDDVTDAYIKLRNAGIDPTRDSLRILGDAGVGSKKSLIDAVEAVTKAQQGQYGALDDFGIRAEKVGQRVRFTWEQDGKRMTLVARRTSDDVQKALLGIFDQRFGGTMAREAKGWEALWVRMGLARDSFLGRVAEKGVLDKAIGMVSSFLDFVDRAEKDGRLDKWAQSASDSLGKMLDSLERLAKAVDWIKLASDLAAIAGGIAAIAEALGKLDRAPRPKIGLDLGNLDPGNFRPPSFRSGKGEQPRPNRRLPTQTPWADGWPRASRPAGRSPRPALPGLGGPPLTARVDGKIEVGLEPGMRIVRATDPAGLLDYRRGPTGTAATE